METARRIDDHHVGILGHGALDAVVSHGGRVGAHLLLDDVHAGAFGPNDELVHGGGTEGVGRAEHHFLSLGTQLGGQFADGRGLAHAVDADHHHDIGLLRKVEGRHALAVRRCVEQSNDLLAEIAVHFVGAQILVAGDPLLEPLDDVLGGFDADVGGDQHLFQRVEHLIVDHALARDGVGKLLEQRTLGLLQAAVEGTFLRLVFLFPIEKSHITKVYTIL